MMICHSNKHKPMNEKEIQDQMKVKQTQIAKVRAHLLKGYTLTPLEAYDLCGTIRLGAIIYTLRHVDNLPIKNLNPKGKYAIYAI